MFVLALVTWLASLAYDSAEIGVVLSFGGLALAGKLAGSLAMVVGLLLLTAAGWFALTTWRALPTSPRAPRQQAYGYPGAYGPGYGGYPTYGTGYGPPLAGGMVPAPSPPPAGSGGPGYSAAPGHGEEAWGQPGSAGPPASNAPAPWQSWPPQGTASAPPPSAGPAPQWPQWPQSPKWPQSAEAAQATQAAYGWGPVGYPADPSPPSAGGPPPDQAPAQQPGQAPGPTPGPAPGQVWGQRPAGAEPGTRDPDREDPASSQPDRSSPPESGAGWNPPASGPPTVTSPAPPEPVAGGAGGDATATTSWGEPVDPAPEDIADPDTESGWPGQDDVATDEAGADDPSDSPSTRSDEESDGPGWWRPAQ